MFKSIDAIAGHQRDKSTAARGGLSAMFEKIRKRGCGVMGSTMTWLRDNNGESVFQSLAVIVDHVCK